MYTRVDCFHIAQENSQSIVGKQMMWGKGFQLISSHLLGKLCRDGSDRETGGQGAVQSTESGSASPTFPSRLVSNKPADLTKSGTQMQTPSALWRSSRPLSSEHGLGSTDRSPRHWWLCCRLSNLLLTFKRFKRFNIQHPTKHAWL